MNGYYYVSDQTVKQTISLPPKHKCSLYALTAT